MDRLIQTQNLNSTFSAIKTANGRSVAIANGQAYPIQSYRPKVPKLAQETAVVYRRPPGGSLSKLGSRQSDIYSRSEYLEPDIRNPLLSPSNFYLPQTLIELNAWIRYFDRFHPIVGNAIDMHATVPFSRFQLTGIPDSFIQQFYEDMSDEMDLFRNLLGISREYELMGESFPFLNWNDEMNAFDAIIHLNPDYVDVKGVKMAGPDGLRYELVISEELREFINSDDPLDWEIIQEMDPALVMAAESGLNAPLHEFNVTHIARFQNPYDKRGTSIVTGCLKDLMHEERLREAQYTVAGGVIRPREIWKLGIPGEYMPTDKDLQNLRQLLRSFGHDPNAALISHHGLNVDFLGADRRLLPVERELDQIENRVLTRLFTSKAMTTGVGPTYSNAAVSMKVLDARYATKRDLLVDWMRNQIFLPVALANEFYKPIKREINFQYRVTDREREPLIPDFKWLELVNLVEKERQLQYASQLYQRGMGIPLKTLCDLLQLEYDEVKEYLRKEQGTVADPTWQEVRKQAGTAAARNMGTSEEVGPGGGLFPEKQGPTTEKEEEGGKKTEKEKASEEIEEQAEREEREAQEEVERMGEEEIKTVPEEPELKTFALDGAANKNVYPTCKPIKRKAAKDSKKKRDS